MSRLVLLLVLCLTASGIRAVPAFKAEKKEVTGPFYLRPGMDSLVLVEDFSAGDVTVEYNLVPQNSWAQTGIVLRYVDEKNWVYVGCDKATDHFGFAYWYVETPAGRTEIARDIAKLYAHHKRHIKVNCIGRTVTLYVDGEQVTHRHLPGLPLNSGKVGFRVHGNGAVNISDVECKTVESGNEVKRSRGGYVLTSSQLEVTMERNFPAVCSYLWKKDGSRMEGRGEGRRCISINGDVYRPEVKSRMDSNRIIYDLKVKELKVGLRVCCELKEHVLQLTVTEVDEQGTDQVRTLAFPEHQLVSLADTVSGACLSVANNVSSDQFYRLREKLPDSTYRYGSILILNSERLAATLESNSIYNTRQFLYQTVRDGGVLRTGIWGNEWIYRGLDGKVVDKPYIRVVLSDDCNGDGRVDWQDGAMALQQVYPAPFGAEMIRNSYATITMNFYSFAQYPFLRQLDNIKRFYLATDGFGQMVELKGYQSEGHDSAHPDYAGNYNERAGGRDDLAFLAREARKYNARIGVHLNHSEAYPEAKAFHDRIVTDMPAWCWLDQAYFINKEADVLNGGFEKRLNKLKADVPDLAFVYLDTYREYRWLAHRTARLFRQNGWAVWTEDADVFDKEAVWIHYNPEARSLIHRFVHHQYRDGYAEHPALLGGYSRGAEIGFMGWQKGRDFHGVVHNFFTRQLPYRYLMHYPLLELDSVRAVLAGGLEAFGGKGKMTTIRRGKQVLMQEGCVCIPWNPETEEKLYHYNPQGGRTVWRLPESWQDRAVVYLYRLSDKGRVFVKQLAVCDRQVEIEALPKTGYVLYRERREDGPRLEWSNGSPVKDMGFDSGDFDYWKIEGNKETVAFRQTAYGQNYLSVGGPDSVSVWQQVKGLQPGREYIASVWVNVAGQREAGLGVRIAGEKDRYVCVSESKVRNYINNSDRGGTTWQRLKLPFRMPSGGEKVILFLSAACSVQDAVVRFDDVRLVEKPVSKREGYVYFEDFEQVDEGWGPFIPSSPASSRTHLSQKHGVYTDNTIQGDWSLATWKERNGEVYRTSPAMLCFVPGKTYEMSFDYRVDCRDVYRVVGRSKTSGVPVFSYDLNRSGKCCVAFTVPACTDFYISVIKQGDGRLVLDNFGIKDLHGRAENF